MKGPILHKNLYPWPDKCEGKRATECGKQIDDRLTTDDWDKVRCKKCQARRPSDKT